MGAFGILTVRECPIFAHSGHPSHPSMRRSGADGRTAQAAHRKRAALPSPALRCSALPSSVLPSPALRCSALPSPALRCSALPSPAPRALHPDLCTPTSAPRALHPDPCAYPPHRDGTRAKLHAPKKRFYPVFLSVRARPHSKAPEKEDDPISKKAENGRKRLADHARKASRREKKESATPPHERYRERGCPRFLHSASELRVKVKERQNKYLWYLPLTSAPRPWREPPFFVPPPLVSASDGRDVTPIPARRKRAPP